MSDVDDKELHRCETVGRVMPHVEVRIVESSSNHILPTNSVGELQTKGYHVMKGYWEGIYISLFHTLPLLPLTYHLYLQHPNKLQTVLTQKDG
jgi:acyl-CoA synthetase (AMP-forming)/AMP-acid ligase II